MRAGVGVGVKGVGVAPAGRSRLRRVGVPGASGKSRGRGQLRRPPGPHRFASVAELARAAVLDQRESTLRHPSSAAAPRPDSVQPARGWGGEWGLGSGVWDRGAGPRGRE